MINFFFPVKNDAFLTKPCFFLLGQSLVSRRPRMLHLELGPRSLVGEAQQDLQVEFGDPLAKDTRKFFENAKNPWKRKTWEPENDGSDFRWCSGFQLGSMFIFRGLYTPPGISVYQYIPSKWEKAPESIIIFDSKSAQTLGGDKC